VAHHRRLVPNVRQRNTTRTRTRRVAYIPHRQNTTMARAAERTGADAHGDRAGSAPRTMRAVDPDQAVRSDHDGRGRSPNSGGSPGFTTMFMVFAVIALVVAAVGLYAVTAYAGDPAHSGDRRAFGARCAASQVIWFSSTIAGALTIGLIIASLPRSLSDVSPVVPRADEHP